MPTRNFDDLNLDNLDEFWNWSVWHHVLVSLIIQTLWVMVRVFFRAFWSFR